MTKEEMNRIKNFVLDFSISTDFQEVGRIDGMKFKVYPNEQGHNAAHVHMETSSASVSIEITTLKILECSGKITSKKIQKAVTWVADNREMLIKNWNEFTNGVKIDV